VQAYGFAAHYHSAIAFEPGGGAGAAVGRSFQRGRLRLEGGFEYMRAEQRLRLITGSRDARTDLYQVYCTAYVLALPDPEARIQLLTGLRMGLLHLRPQRLTLDAGAAGSIQVGAGAETKMSPGAGVGVMIWVTHRLAAVLLAQYHVLRVEVRRTESPGTQRAWKSYSHLRAGLSLYF
jgi:hypothetical protein